MCPADGALSCTVSWWVMDNLKPTLVVAAAIVAWLEDSKLLNVVEADAAPWPGRGSRSWSCLVQLHILLFLFLFLLRVRHGVELEEVGDSYDVLAVLALLLMLLLPLVL